MPALRDLPSASSSSMNTMQGAFCVACANRSRTRAAPTPTNISTNSEPESEKNGTPASPAVARASSVLPVPGGPTSSTPFGIRPPSRRYFSGVFRNSTISCSSSTASSMPAASWNVTPVSGSMWIRARDFPNAITPGGPCPSCPDMRRITQAQNSSPIAIGAIQTQNRSPMPPPATAS
jgi:hypothetical protein